MIAPEQFEELNRRYSDYDSRSIMKVLQENGWFSSIEQVYDLKVLEPTKPILSSSWILSHQLVRF